MASMLSMSSGTAFTCHAVRLMKHSGTQTELFNCTKGLAQGRVTPVTIDTGQVRSWFIRQMLLCP